jgi:hypothetical protein
MQNRKMPMQFASYQEQVGTAGDLHDEANDLKEICSSIERNCGEINAAMEVLSIKTKRRLENSPSSHITGHTIGTDMISMYDCDCDTNNLTNAGCLANAMHFGEELGLSIEQQAEVDFSEDGGTRYMQDLLSLLEHQTHHLRGPDLTPAVKSKSAVATAESFGCNGGTGTKKKGTKKRKKEDSGVESSYTGFSFCIYAGSLFECNISFDIISGGSGCLATMLCGDGVQLQIEAEAKVCYNNGDLNIKLMLRLCVAAVSDIIGAIGGWIPSAEKIFNKFNIFGGCYKLAEGTYSITYNRLEVVMPEHRAPIVGGLIGGLIVRISGHARFRFKGYGCPYNDNLDWYKHEYMAKYSRNGAYDSGKYNHQVVPNFNRRNTCSWRTSQWVQFRIKFRLTMGKNPIFFFPLYNQHLTEGLISPQRSHQTTPGLNLGINALEGGALGVAGRKFVRLGFVCLWHTFL